MMAYGVIGNTTVSGTVILGSSPGRPAVITAHSTTVLCEQWSQFYAPFV